MRTRSGQASRTSAYPRRQGPARWPALAALALLAFLLWPGLAVPADADGKALYEAKGCPICHGEDGRTPRGDSYPIIAGQQARYVYLTLRAYKTGERAGIGSNMHVDVSDFLTDEDMKQLAEYVATLQ